MSWGSQLQGLIAAAKQKKMTEALPPAQYGQSRTFTPQALPQGQFMPPAQQPQAQLINPNPNAPAPGQGQGPGQMQGLLGGNIPSVFQHFMTPQMIQMLQQRMQQNQGGQPRPMPNVTPGQAPADGNQPVLRSPGMVENPTGPQQFGNNLGFSGRMDRQMPMFSNSRMRV